MQSDNILAFSPVNGKLAGRSLVDPWHPACIQRWRPAFCRFVPAYIAWVMFGAFFARGRPRLAALHVVTPVCGVGLLGWNPHLRNEGQLIFSPEFIEPQCVPIPAVQRTDMLTPLTTNLLTAKRVARSRRVLGVTSIHSFRMGTCLPAMANESAKSVPAPNKLSEIESLRLGCLGIHRAHSYAIRPIGRSCRISKRSQ